MPSRSRGPRRGPGRFLHWKIRLIAVGAVFLLVGMARNLELLVAVSLVFLGGAFILRFFEKDDPPDADPADDPEEVEPDGDGPPHHADGLDGEGPRPAA